MDDNSKSEIREKIDLKELDNLPETIEDIEKNPILKPLIEFHKQATMLEKEDKIEANFLKEIKDEIEEDMKLGIYDNSYIVKKYKNLEREYDRLILVYSRYTDLADEKIIELKRIVEKYYTTKKVDAKVADEYEREIEELKRKVRELKEAKKEPIIFEKEQEKKIIKIKEEIEEDDEEKEYQEFLKRKLKSKK